jgi:cytochrome c oxidase subunit 2
MPAGVRRRALAVGVAFLVSLAVCGIAGAGNGGLLPPPPHSPNADRITSTYIFVLIFTGAVFLAVEGTLVVFIVKYRRGRRPRTADGPQIHGATRLEILWTVVPVLILAAIASFVFYELPGIIDAPAATASNETRITVEGHQFYWLFRYPNGAVSINKMVAPADAVVHEDITAPDTDVNHSWWVPELGGKFDAIPGTVNHTWFQAPVGTYVARCAELCGIQHALMDGEVDVVPRSQYDSFVAERRVGGTELGREEWEGVCLTCHRLDEPYVGPALGGNPLIRDPEALTLLLRNGRGQMPAVGSNWTQQQIDALVAYTKTLPGGAQDGG